MEQKRYPGELTDQEWKLIKPLVENKSTGRKPKYGKRRILDAIFYLLRSGCSWRLLPHDFPPWQTVYSQFAKWKIEGVFQKMHDSVRKNLRVLLGRTAEASGAIIDSQSIKTTERGGSVGMMEVKRLKEEKDTLPLIRKGFYYRRILPRETQVIRKGSKYLSKEKTSNL